MRRIIGHQIQVLEGQGITQRTGSRKKRNLASDNGCLTYALPYTGIGYHGENSAG